MFVLCFHDHPFLLSNARPSSDIESDDEDGSENEEDDRPHLNRLFETLVKHPKYTADHET